MILNRLKEIRLGRALSMRDLTLRSGVTATTLVRAEKGLDVYPTTVRKLAKALGVSPAELRGDPTVSAETVQPAPVPIDERRAVLVANMLDQAERARARGDDEGAATFERMAAEAAVAEA
jgi:transcriptional regulator with XRE-family HTH domain